MLVMNWKNISDAPMPPDNSVREAARDRAVEILKDVIADELMQSRVRVAESRGFFTTREDDAIEAAIMAGDAMKVGMLTIGACRRVVAVQAESEAERRVDLMEREDERDYAAMAMED